MELKRSLLNHITHLLACGYVIPIVDYIHNCMENETMDNSLIRGFISEVMTSSYSKDLFVNVCN